MPGFNDGAAILHCLLELLQRKRNVFLLQHILKSGYLALLVDLGVVEVVGWRLGHIQQKSVNKLLEVFYFEGVVFGELSFQGAEVALPYILAARRPRTMSWVDPHRMVHHFFDLRQRVEELLS